MPPDAADDDDAQKRRPVSGRGSTHKIMDAPQLAGAGY
jgi:hypothetical protein